HPRMPDEMKLLDRISRLAYLRYLAKHIDLAFDRLADDVAVKPVGPAFIGQRPGCDGELSPAEAILGRINNKGDPHILPLAATRTCDLCARQDSNTKVTTFAPKPRLKILLLLRFLDHADQLV